MAIKVRPAEIENQIAGLNRAVSHATQLFRRDVISQDELHAVETFALEQRMGPLMSTEEYIQARNDGSFEKYEALMSDSRTPSAPTREMAARKVAAAYVAEQALNQQLPKAQTQEEHNAILRDAREKMASFVDMTDEDADHDVAVWEKHAKITLGDEVKKPVEEPSWAKPVQRISDDDASARDFRLRDENTFGAARHGKAYDGAGVKRAADGRIIAKTTLREDADKPKPKKSEYDDTRGYTVDHEIGVVSSGEMEAIQKYETDRHNDAVAAVEVNPPTYVEPGPVTLPNSIE